MKVRNNNIYAAIGENIHLSFNVYNADGAPFILPPSDGLLSVIAFTIKSDVYNKIVLQKYINMRVHIPEYNGEFDYSDGGYNKFTSQQIKELDSVLTLDVAKADVENGEIFVYHCNIDGIDIYQHLGKTLDGEYVIMPYLFTVPIQLDYYDTYKFAVQNYKYDIILYMGTANNTLTDSDLREDIFTVFPISNISLKRELLSPKLFIAEATNNV